MRARCHAAALAVVAVVAVTGATVPLGGAETFAFLQTGSEAQRRVYLGQARIWHDPGALTPADVLAGPARPPVIPPGADGAPPALSCRFARPGATLAAPPRSSCAAPPTT